MATQYLQDYTLTVKGLRNKLKTRNNLRVKIRRYDINLIEEKEDCVIIYAMLNYVKLTAKQLYSRLYSVRQYKPVYGRYKGEYYNVVRYMRKSNFKGKENKQVVLCISTKVDDSKISNKLGRFISW